MTSTHIDLELIRKYNQPGPRYTSYPPATHFTEAAVPDLLERMAHQPPEPLSLYFHLPFCARQCLYCGCTNIISSRQKSSADYMEQLRKEIQMRATHASDASHVQQIQLGGGTPTFLLPEEIDLLGALIKEHFTLGETIEAGVEIDPRQLSLEKVDALNRAGFNRASLGVQDTNPDVQKLIGRIQPMELNHQAIEWLRMHNMRSINIDLIYGLPGQTLESFSQTIDDVISLNPDRLAVYSYAHIPWIKPFQHQLEPHLPDAEHKMELFKTAIEKLTDAGYVYIGMDHFARPNDALTQALQNGTLQRNFQGYSTCKGGLLHGMGISSISHLDGMYLQNHKILDTYYDALNKDELPIMRGYVMTDEDRLRYAAIMQIMCSLFLDYTTTSNDLGIDFSDYFQAEIASLDDLEADGLLQREDTGITVTQTGRLFIRNIAMRFDPNLTQEKKKGRYSQTV